MTKVIQPEMRLAVLKLRRLPCRLTAPPSLPQRGGCKIGCMFSLVILVMIAALAIKILPVYHSNSKFIDAVEDIASRAEKIDQETIAAQIAEKAKEYNIPEARVAGAVKVSRTIINENGMCTVRINYAREIDLYGILIIKLPTDKNIAKPFMVT